VRSEQLGALSQLEPDQHYGVGDLLVDSPHVIAPVPPETAAGAGRLPVIWDQSG
jgi:hypothetical protein